MVLLIRLYHNFSVIALLFYLKVPLKALGYLADYIFKFHYRYIKIFLNLIFHLNLKLIIILQIRKNSQTVLMTSSNYDYLFKFIVIGDTGVGKSCVVLQFIQQKINSNHDVTIGVQFAAKNLKIGKKKIKLQIWDTAGQQNFRSITRSYYRSAIGALLVYDITRRQSFEHLQQWLQQVKANGNAAMQVLLVGNKTDLEQERQITYEQGKKYAQQQGLAFLEITATDYKKVELAFNTLAQRIIQKMQKGDISEDTVGIKVSEELRIDPLRKTNKKTCC